MHNQKLRDSDRWVELAVRALDALELGVFVLRRSTLAVLLRNACASRVFGDGPLPPSLIEAVHSHRRAGGRNGQRPPAVRVELEQGNFYVRTVDSAGTPPGVIVVVRREVVRDADLYRHLSEHRTVTRREYQVICGLRGGKTNREIAEGIGIAESTVARHVHRLLRRFEVPNRTRLVQVIEQDAMRSG